MKKVDIEKLKELEPEFAKICETLIEELIRSTGLQWAIVQGVRTIAYQNSLYNQPFDGKDNDGDGKIDEPDEKVTNAKGGQSPHNFKQAIDLCPIKDGKLWWNAPEKYWIALCELAEGMGLASGYRFNIKGLGKDRPHIESKEWKEDQKLWKEGKITIK